MDKVAGNQHLQLTAEVLTNDTNPPPPSTNKEKVQIMANDELPFLDMQMSWYPEGDMEFGLFRKKGQQLKYIGKGSNHTPGNLRVIALGIINRLSKTT